MLVGLDFPVPVVLADVCVLLGLAVVERLPPVGAAVVTDEVMVVSVVSADDSELLVEVDDVLGAAVVLLLPLLEDEEVLSPLALMTKGKEYWKVVGSESSVMRMPYVACVPSVLSTAQEYSPALLSTPSGEEEVSGLCL